MSPNRRIFLNIVATYGRSLYALVIGLFCGRWALQALGEVDYGLYGLIGGLTLFVSFVNNLFSSAVGRFFAVSVGSGQIKGHEAEGLDACRKWFNTAVTLHVLLPIGLVAVGYPIGVWMLEDFLTIPLSRISDCVWVWRFTCIGCFVSMVTVPFNAMYIAKQKIAELTVYSVLTTTLNVVMLYYMISHEGIWLVWFAFYTMLLTVLPQILLTVVAIWRFRECLFVRSYMWDCGRVRDILKFAFARFWTALSQVVSSQGNSILVNKYLGPAYNASMSVGSSVSGHAATLSGAVSGAFWPVIANKAGAHDFDGMRRFAFQTCRLSTAMILIFAIPLLLEIKMVLKMWLVTPPADAWAICSAVLVSLILERMTEGYWMAIIGEGSRVSLYSLVVSLSGFLGFSISWLFFSLGGGIRGLCGAMILSWLITVVVRLALGRVLVGMSVEYWLRKVLFPILVAAVASFLFGWGVRGSMDASFGRVCLTTLACEAVLLPAIWFFLFAREERQFVLERACRFVYWMKPRKICYNKHKLLPSPERESKQVQ